MGHGRQSKFSDDVGGKSSLAKRRGHASATLSPGGVAIVPHVPPQFLLPYHRIHLNGRPRVYIQRRKTQAGDLQDPEHRGPDPPS